MRQLSSSTNLVITNPLVLYRSLIATKQLEPDPAQHRLAIHLQNVHKRLRDYDPELDFRERLKHIRSLVAGVRPRSDNFGPQKEDDSSVPGGLWAAWRQKSKHAEVTALTRSLTNQQSAAELDSPQGLLLHGEVGTGKSLLSQLLADCLPGNRIQRWHFNTFMLSMYAKIEKLRKASLDSGYDEYALLQISRDLILESPVLFIDEFQFPDRATSKILSNLLTSFFHLGGVLIATSNRMPEQLADAAGFDFSAPPSRSRPAHGATSKAELARIQKERNLTKGDFGDFLELLKARCEIWNIEGKQDWRRRDASREQNEVSKKLADRQTESDHTGLHKLEPGNLGLGFEQSREIPLGVQAVLGHEESTSHTIPPYYFVKNSESQLNEKFEQEWMASEMRAINRSSDQQWTDGYWQPDSISIYGRSVRIPRQYESVTKWTFDELCTATLGPADYVSLASCFHTFIIVDVPILTAIHKNEARRFITLLDALYEARCRLLVSAYDNPDHILFPENVHRAREDQGSDNGGFDSVYAETFSEIHQDQTLPFRPNIAAYSPSASQPDYPTSPMLPEQAKRSSLRSILADEDSDFGPVYGAGRHHSQPNDNHSSAGDDASKPNFSQIETFTGQDEMFAYKRAESRLWEMCSERWWLRGTESWRPLPREARHWEHVALHKMEAPEILVRNPSLETTAEDVMFRHGASPFRRSESPPPRFNWTHAWGMALWGKKAGAWGLGPQGLADRRKSSK